MVLHFHDHYYWPTTISPPIWSRSKQRICVCAKSEWCTEFAVLCSVGVAVLFFSRENKRTFLRAERRAVRFWGVHLGWLRGTRHFCTVPSFSIVDVWDACANSGHCTTGLSGVAALTITWVVMPTMSVWLTEEVQLPSRSRQAKKGVTTSSELFFFCEIELRLDFNVCLFGLVCPLHNIKNLKIYAFWFQCFKWEL